MADFSDKSGNNLDQDYVEVTYLGEDNGQCVFELSMSEKTKDALDTFLSERHETLDELAERIGRYIVDHKEEIKASGNFDDFLSKHISKMLS